MHHADETVYYEQLNHKVQLVQTGTKGENGATKQRRHCVLPGKQ